MLWKLLTDKNARESNSSDQNDKFKERIKRVFCTMYDVDGPNIPPSEIVNTAPGEGESPVSFASEPN